MCPIRRVPKEKIQTINKNEIGSVIYSDFIDSMKTIKPTVDKSIIEKLEQFKSQYGC